MVLLSPQVPTPSKPPSTAQAATSVDIPSTLSAITSKSHLHRERAITEFETDLPTWTLLDISTTITLIEPFLVPAQPWETLYGALKASTLLVAHPSIKPDFCAKLTLLALGLVSHTEPRVRGATSGLLKELAVSRGVVVWDEVGEVLLGIVATNLGLDEKQRLEEASRVAKVEVDEHAANAKLKGLRMVHETEGWRGLETSLLALGDLIDGCGAGVLERGIEEMDRVIDFLLKARKHPNRFVREAGLKVVDKLGKAARGIDGEDRECVLGDLVGRLVTVIKEGLEDNWSQVRYAASVAVRTVLEGLAMERRKMWYEVLLPRMCLNRHYVAEGVRALSRETWSQVIGADGRRFLRKYFGATVEFYETQCVADNHAVREAACQGFGEVCAQLPREAVVLYVDRVIAGLLMCFKDESWPVRDHACSALAVVMGLFPGEAEKGGRLSESFDLFEAHLGDNIGSVRANCARALAETCIKFDSEHAVFGVQRVLGIAVGLMKRMKFQKEEKYGLAGGERRDREVGYGCANKIARDNDETIHTNQVMYSCGSLAPKLRRGGGCMDHGFAREKHPWEEADGGLRLWGSLVELGVPDGWTYFGEVVRLGEIGVELEFGQGMKMREGWLDVVSKAVGGVGPEVIKEHLVGVVGVVEVCRKMQHTAVKTAAAACARTVRREVGLKQYAEAERAVKSKEEH